MITFPNAKINIGLNVLNKRNDGYHNLETIFYPIRLTDALEVVESQSLSFTSSGIDIPGESSNNLCLKAYNLIAQDYKVPQVHIHLHKHIPIGAGLGGGSSDASFLIKLLNDKFELGIEIAQMEQYASQLGSDCPFFIQNKPSIAFGRGNELEPIALDLKPYFIVLIMPQVHVSTSEAYRGVIAKENLNSLIDLIKLPIEEWKANVKNDFEDSVFPQYPIIGEIKSKLYDSGALFVSMSGSGASVFGIFKNEIKLPDLEKNNQVFYGV